MQMESPTPVRLHDLGFGSCRWPVGSSPGPTEFFCGEPVVLGCSWCAEHRKRAFVATKRGARDPAGRALSSA
jgi:hypothetical protein